MADVVVDPESKNPKELLGQGIRAYILQDYTSAVSALSKASELLVTEHGDDLHDSLADVYLYYGKSLLGLSREETGALGDAVLKNAEEDSDEEDVENTETEEGDDKSNGEAKANGAAEVDKGKAEENDEGKDDVKEADDENKVVESSSNSLKEGEPSGSAEATVTNDEEPSDLQVAWEVLELAKKIYQRHGEGGKKNLAETLIVLGEISLEDENFEAAINDIKEGLQIQKELFSRDSRTVAETYYKLGVAFATNSQIDEAVQSFKDSLEYLQSRINTLEKTEDKKDELVKEIEDEIEEIRSLMPDIEEKIAEMKSYKDEAMKQIASAIKESNPSRTASASCDASSSKPATDISHLVKRKRKLEEIAEENEVEDSPSKKSI